MRYGLWLAASIKFLIPFSFLIALGEVFPKPAQPVAPAVYAAMKLTEQPFADLSSTFATPVTPTLLQRLSADIPAILLALWLAGAVAILIAWFVRSRKASIEPAVAYTFDAHLPHRNFPQSLQPRFCSLLEPRPVKLHRPRASIIDGWAMLVNITNMCYKLAWINKT